MMTSHKHSFQCFDAVVEKPSLPPRHNFALPHRSSFTSTHWEQLENYRCSLCPESQQAKPVTSEISGNQSASWYQPQSPIQQHTPRRPMRPEDDPVDGLAHHHHSHHHQCHTRRHCKTIVLVKNSNPSIQKTILLYRKPLHSLGVFMDDVSELMQCLIRKLYTLDGHKVDSVQNLLQGPSILVCVGREPFHPHLLDSFQKNSEDKLPKLILKSQSSTCNEDQGYKKNVNFGLKSKKSIPPGPFPKARKNMLDDDIEKRVLVNKDGSLSMEMKVRFRLLNDETLHCSTEIKKSSCTFNVSFPGQDNVYYPQYDHGESCSEAESLSASEADDVYVTKLYQKHLDAPHCQHCCTHCQEYDIWKNPARSEPETLRHIRSTSSSAPSYKIKGKMGSVDSVHTTSCEEYTEQVVEKATCIQQTVGEGGKGDTTVQYCTISRCSSRSEVYSVCAKAKKASYTDEKYGKNESIHGFAEEEKRPVPSKDLKQDQMSVPITQVSTEDERPLSVETNSSDILASLKEDEDNEETDLSPSHSRASQSNKENDEQTKNAVVSSYSFTPCKPPGSPKQSLSPRSSSTASCCSVKSKTFRKFVVTETQENVDQDKNNTPSSTSHRCQHKESTDYTAEEKLEAINQSENVLDETDVLDTETDVRALKSVSDLAKTCDDTSDDTIETSQTNEKGRSNTMSTPPNPHADLTISETCVVAEQEFGNLKDPTVGYAKNKTEESADVTHEEKGAIAMSPKSNASVRSSRSRLSEVACKETTTPELQNGERAQSVMTVHSNASTISKQSTVSELLDNKTEDQTEEVMPCALSKISRSSKISDLETSDLREMEDRIEDRSPCTMFVKSSISESTPVKLVKVQSSESLTISLSTNISVESITAKISDGTPVDMDNKLLKERVPTVMSAKSDVSIKSKTSNILDISPHDSNVVEEATEDRAPSAKSNKSNTSSRSNASKISLVAPEEADVVEEKRLKRPSSVRSSKSDVSVKSKTSNILDISPHDSNVVEKATEDRAPSAKSNKSNKSNTSSRSNASKISLVAPEEADVVEEKRLKRPSSGMSSKSAVSLRSTKSQLRDEKDDITTEKTEQLQDRYITRVMSSKPSESVLSKKTKTKTEATLDKSGDFEDNSKEQAPSTMSTKSNTPTKSNKAEMLEMGMGEKEKTPLSAKSKKSEKCKTSEAVQVCDHSEESSAGIISSISVKSKRSVDSDAPCEHEEEERKQTSRKSQNALSVRSQRSRDNRERAQSAMSCTSILSDRSNLAPDGVDNTGSTEDLLKETESAFEETKDDRAASAMSSKSQMSSLSNKSKDLTQERAPATMSEKSKVSIKPKNSKMDKSKNECEEKHERTSVSASPNSNMSARSKKYESLAVVSNAEMENQHTERTLSAMSGKSNTSKTSKKKKQELVERSPSARSVKSNTSVRSKESDTQSNRPMDKIRLGIISPKSNTSAKDEKFDFSIISNNSPMVVVKSEEAWDMSDMSPKSSVSSKSNISALAGGQTDGVSSNEKSDSVLSGLISVTENLNNANNEERASSALSKKSNTGSIHHTSERVLTPASTSVSIGIVEEYDVDYAEEDNSVSLASVNSTPQLKSKTDVYCKDSSKTTKNKIQQCMQTPDDRAKSSLTAETIVADKSKESECTHKNSSQPITDNEMANKKSAKKNPKKSSSRSLCSRSAHSDFASSKTKDRNSPAVTDRPKSNMSNTLLHLEVNGQSTKANAKCNSVGERSKSNLSSDEGEISRLHSTAVLITSVSTDNEPVISVDVSNRRSSPANENANKLNTTRDLNVCGRTCNGSLDATDCSRDINDNKSEKNSNSSYRHSSSSMTQEVDNNSSELVPSILPSSSPTEVVYEWLKNIPLDLYVVGDEFHENCEVEELLKMSGTVTQCEGGKGSKGDIDAAVLRPQNEQLGVEEIENNESKVGDVKETAKDLAVVENIQPCTFPDVPSSVQLMRILLSPKLDRCNSLPEVSPVYGRKLSTSARGFLDSLVNLQLLDLDPKDVNGKAEKYNNLMDTLQSLWLCDTSDSVAITQKSTFNTQQEFNVKPSSGVDITSNSQDSGTSSVNESTVTQKSRTNTEGEDIEILTKVHDIDKTETVFKGIETKSNSATPDIASRVQWTPENEAEENLQDSNILSAVSDFTIRNDYSPREPPDTASISNKNSGNDSNSNQKLTDHDEDTSSESPSLEQTAQLTEKFSQDPDPVWVLNLLNKIEKQFMTHYITAMAEFKVRWNLNDNEQLDAMICELRDEVHKRIQASINNELRKFQGHTGRPRPPKETMSRESSILTEQRRRHLKVHLNQSIDTGSGILMTDFGNQRNDDEYCPCDTCLKKKTSSKPTLAMEVLNFAQHAPMMTDFDLRKILNLERKAPSNSKENVKETDNEDASNTQPNKSEQLKNDQPMREGNNTSRALEQESPIVGGELGDHVELRNGTKILEVANADPTAEEENAQSGIADMVTEVKMTEAVEEVCDELPGGQESVEDETVREEHILEAGTAKDNMAIEAGTVGEQEVTEGESTGGKATEVQTSDAETGDETAEDKTLDKKKSMGESTSEDNESAEGDISESEPEEEGEIPDEEKETHEDAKTETTWKNMLVEPDIAVEAESIKGDVAGKEVATIATEEPKIKYEIIEDVKEAEHKSDGIMHLEDEEDDTAGESESTDNEERDEKNESDEEDVSIKKISKESGEDDLFDEEMISEPEEDGDITEHESAEEANPINNESEKGETDSDELDSEGKTSKAETAADEELADNETAEYRENFYDGALDRTEIIKVKTAEIGETNNNVATENGEMSVDKVADVGETSEANTAEDNDYESAEDAETSKAQITENTSDDETAENGETPKAKISEDGEVTDDEIANDAIADDGVTGDTEMAVYRDTDDEEISEIEEMFCNETVDNGVTANAKNMKPQNMKKATEYEETHDDGSSEDGDSAGAVVADDEETAEPTEESESNNDDESTEESEGAKTEIAEQTVDSKIVEAGEAHTKALKQFVGDKMNIDNVQKTEGEQTNDETAEDTEMDRTQSEEDGETADDEADIGEIADDGRAEDGETPNDNTSDDGTAEEYDMEKVDETIEAETAVDGEKDDDGRTDGQIGDEVTDDESIIGTENEENEETSEAKTGEDIETADNGTIEDGDTDDERKPEDEELSENEIAQNGEIANGRIEVYEQTDDSESLDNGETAGEVNGETLEKNTDEAVVNSHNIKTKQISEMMSINQDAEVLESNRYNVNIHSVNNIESDEGGDEAEDESEPIVETDERAFYQGIKIPAMQSTKWSLHKDVHADERTIASFDSAVKMYPASEDGEDADGEESETEVHNKLGSVENEEEV